MQSSTRDIIQSTFEASNRGSIHFGPVIAALSPAGVEFSHVDYRAGRSTSYLPDGETMELAFEAVARVTSAFQSEAIRSANRGAQRGKVMWTSDQQSLPGPCLRARLRQCVNTLNLPT